MAVVGCAGVTVREKPAVVGKGSPVACRKGGNHKLLGFPERTRQRPFFGVCEERRLDVMRDWGWTCMAFVLSGVCWIGSICLGRGGIALEVAGTALCAIGVVLEVRKGNRE